VVTRRRAVLRLAHVTNQMVRVDGDFGKGVVDGAELSLKVVMLVVAGWQYGQVS
jgi:hypothetical protein